MCEYVCVGVCEVPNLQWLCVWINSPNFLTERNSVPCSGTDRGCDDDDELDYKHRDNM